MPEALLDATMMMAQAGQDADLARELSDVFLETSDALLADAETSLLQADWSELARASHTLKSPFAFFGAQESVALAQTIENQADAKDESHLKEQLAALRLNVKQLQEELRQYFGQADGASD